MFTEVDGLRRDARSDYDFRIENRKTGAGVHVTGDRPLRSCCSGRRWKTVCPEPYIDVRVEPGKEFGLADHLPVLPGRRRVTFFTERTR